MEIIQNFLTKNDCYIANQYIVPTKIMLHSTAMPGIPAKNFLVSWNKPFPPKERRCVHAFLEPDKVYQTLPWNMRAWGCGGTGNNICIQFEICEPENYADREYFLKVKKTALELCAYLCKEYRLTPADVTSHCEGYKDFGSSFASNHSDLDHWWKAYHDYTMDDFRIELYNFMNEGENDDMKRFYSLEEVPEYGKPTIKKLVDRELLKGNNSGLDLSEDMLRILVILDRAKVFDKPENYDTI